MIINKCKYCGSTDIVLGEERKDGQQSLICGKCGKWLKWCPKDERKLYKNKDQDINSPSELQDAVDKIIKARYNNPKLHELKIHAEYMKAKLNNAKLFEIRKNDRNFHVGDLVQYTVLDDNLLQEVVRHNFYIITYITDFEQKPGYIVYGEKLIKFL